MSKQAKQSRTQNQSNGVGKLDNTKPASIGGMGNSAPGKHKRGKQG